MIGPERQLTEGWSPKGLLPEHKESKVQRLVHSLREEISLTKRSKDPFHLQLALSHSKELLSMNYLPQISTDRGQAVSAHNLIFPKEWERFEPPEKVEKRNSSEEWLKYQEIKRSFELLDEVSQKRLLRELRMARKEIRR